MPALLPPYRADHVGSLLRPPVVLEGARRRCRGRITRRSSSARSRTTRSRRRADAGGRRAPGRHRRRVPPRLLAHGLHLPARGCRQVGRDVPSSSATTARAIEFKPTALMIGKLGLPKTIFADAFTFLNGPTKRTPKLTIPSPSMVHYRGGRGGDRPVGLSGHRRLLGRPRRGVRGGDRRLAGSAAPTCSSTTRASPT